MCTTHIKTCYSQVYLLVLGFCLQKHMPEDRFCFDKTISKYHLHKIQKTLYNSTDLKQAKNKSYSYCALLLVQHTIIIQLTKLSYSKHTYFKIYSTTHHNNINVQLGNKGE